MNLTKQEKLAILSTIMKERGVTGALCAGLISREKAGDKAAGREMDSITEVFEKRCDAFAKKKKEMRGDKSFNEVLKRLTTGREALVNALKTLRDPVAEFKTKAKSEHHANAATHILKSGKPLTESQCVYVYSRSKKYIGSPLSEFEINNQFYLQERDLVSAAVSFCRNLGCRIK